MRGCKATEDRQSQGQVWGSTCVDLDPEPEAPNPGQASTLSFPLAPSKASGPVLTVPCHVYFVCVCTCACILKFGFILCAFCLEVCVCTTTLLLDVLRGHKRLSDLLAWSSK